VLETTDGLTLTHEACLPSPGRYTASQTLYQNRLPRFYGDLWGVLICLQHPGRRASLVFRPMLLRGGWSLSAGFIPAFTGFCISISLSVLWRAGASHGALGITLLASAIHGLPFFLPRSQRRLLLTCGVRMARGTKKADYYCSRWKPSCEGRSMSNRPISVGFHANGCKYRSVLSVVQGVSQCFPNAGASSQSSLLGHRACSQTCPCTR
jgi:hypothetical protein